MGSVPTFSDPTLVAWSNPLDRPLHFAGLELLMLAGFALTLRHALRSHSRGDRYPLFQWLVIVAYGVMMELIAFNFYQSYDHAQFTVQLYHRKLPLYITAVYVVLHYTGLKAVERLRLSWWSEALLVGFSICLIDVPFDTLGVDAGWWTWSKSDATVGVRWLGVPVTSYYWYLSFGAAFAALCRASKRKILQASLATSVLVAPLVAAGIIVTGMIVFLPFHGLVALGVPEGTVVAAHLAVCLALAVSVRSQHAQPAIFEVRLMAVILPAFFLLVFVVIWTNRGVPDPGLKLLTMLSAAAASNGLVWALPLRRRAGTVVTPSAISR